MTTLTLQMTMFDAMLAEMSKLIFNRIARGLQTLTVISWQMPAAQSCQDKTSVAQIVVDNTCIT